MKTTFQHEIPFEYSDHVPSNNLPPKRGMGMANKKKWTLMFAPNCDKFATNDIDSDVSIDRIISFPRRHCHKALNALERALDCNNCSTLILGEGVFSSDEYRRLEQIALDSHVRVIKMPTNRLH